MLFCYGKNVIFEVIYLNICEVNMKRLALFTITALFALALYACTTCPVPASAPRTYLANAQCHGTQE